MAYGDSTRSWLVAVVVPSENTKIEQEQLRGMVLKACKSAKLMGYETPKEVIVAKEAWTPQNKLTTPTFKIVRRKIKEAYWREILEAYEKGGRRSKL